MDFHSSVSYLKRLEKLGIRFRLENTSDLLAALGFDYAGRVVHVSGTNGKGSAAVALACILQGAGFKVGLYTSPELIDFTERIRVDGEQMPKRDFSRLVARLKPLVGRMKEKPTFFEATTAIALKYFADRKVDVMVLEVGMGGRLDSTNVIPAEISIITNIALDHMQYLGNTVEEIAREKAGIVSPGSTLITAAEGNALHVLETECRRRGASIVRIGHDVQVLEAASGLDGTRFSLKTKSQTYQVASRLRGLFQAGNLACAVVAAERMGVPKKLIPQGVAKAVWPGRLDVMQTDPLVIVDCAHNPAGLKQSMSFISKLSYGRLIVVAAFSEDKDWAQMAAMLSEADVLIATQYGGARSLDCHEIIPVALGEAVPDSRAAVRRALALAGRNDVVFIVGSIYLAGEVMRKWRKRIDL
jgi:dihydrofolate synthase / folylpolyglutamate synthase